MKHYYSIVSLLLAVSGGDTFTTAPHVNHQQPSSLTSLNASKDRHTLQWIFAGAMTGWTLATAPLPALAASDTVVAPIQQDNYPTTMIAAAGAYIPEDTYEITDASLPSYNVMNDVDLAKPTTNGGGAVSRPNSGKSASKPRAATKRTLNAEEMEAKEAAKREKEIARYKELMALKEQKREKEAADKAIRQAMQAKRKAVAAQNAE